VTSTLWLFRQNAKAMPGSKWRISQKCQLSGHQRHSGYGCAESNWNNGWTVASTNNKSDGERFSITDRLSWTGREWARLRSKELAGQWKHQYSLPEDLQAPEPTTSLYPAASISLLDGVTVKIIWLPR
jgi:hypothetical protein